MKKHSHSQMSQNANLDHLIQELQWFKDVIERRFLFTFEKTYTDPDTQEVRHYEDVYGLTPPPLGNEDSGYAGFVAEHNLAFEERFLLALGLAPHLNPGLLDSLLGNKKDLQGRDLCEVGGVRGNAFRGFIPTGLTYLYLLAGEDEKKRLELLQQLNKADFFLISKEVVTFLPVYPGEPVFSGVLALNEIYIQLFVDGEKATENIKFL